MLIYIIIDLEKFNINNYIKFNEKNNTYQDKNIDKLLKELNVDKEKKLFEYSEDGKINNYVVYKSDFQDMSIVAQISSLESKGTIKLIDLLYPIMQSLQQGTPLFIDELDASIHHEIIYNLMQTYGDPNVNTKGAQIIFTTHNPVYLNKNLLRRDETVFIELLDGNYTALPNFDFSNIVE